MISTLLILISIIIFSNASFSMMSYRRYVSENNIESDLKMPLDIKIEVLVALLIGLWGSILGQTDNLKKISFLTATAENNKTYEKATNQHRSGASRNLLKGRSGAIFAHDA